MASMRDLAKAAGVGLGTVSRALSGKGHVAEETRKRIVEAADKMEYRLPERFRNNGNAALPGSVIGVIVPDVALSFYGEFVKAVDIALASKGYSILLLNTLGIQGRAEEMIRLAEMGSISGIIINGEISDDELTRLEKIPVVSFERILGPRIPLVASEHEDGGRKAGQLLIESGCRNVLIIAGKYLSSVSADHRNDACRDYLESKGVKVRVAEVPMSNISVLSIDDIVEKYLELYPDIDGLFSGDLAAYAALQIAGSKGIKVPEQLRIVGYDGNEALQLSRPRLTTIQQNIPLLAQTCTEVLAKKISGEAAQPEYRIPVKVLEGGTI